VATLLTLRSQINKDYGKEFKEEPAAAGFENGCLCELHYER
jgi:hypothetical protein